MAQRPRGYFEKILAIDCETTGLCFKNDNPVHNPSTNERHQTVSWGVIVADAKTLKTIDQLYVEIKWNDTSKAQRENNAQFGVKAEKVHGLTQQHLEQHGVSELQAVEQIGNLLINHWGPTNSIVTLGHNVHTFDMPFLRDLFARHECHLNFGNRHIDTNSIGFVNWNTFNSDDLFEVVRFEQRKEHNALQDIQMTLEAARVTRLLFQKVIN